MIIIVYKVNNEVVSFKKVLNCALAKNESILDNINPSSRQNDYNNRTTIK